jgi:hypothetical protein
VGRFQETGRGVQAGIDFTLFSEISRQKTAQNDSNYPYPGFTLTKPNQMIRDFK